MYKLQNWGNDEKKEAEGLLALATVIGIILYESMFYIICGILITSILYLAYRIILGIVCYEKSTLYLTQKCSIISIFPMVF